MDHMFIQRKKKFLDLGYCAGTLLLGHNHKVLRESFKLLSKKKYLILHMQTINHWSLQKLLKKFFT